MIKTEKSWYRLEVQIKTISERKLSKQLSNSMRTKEQARTKRNKKKETKEFRKVKGYEVVEKLLIIQYLRLFSTKSTTLKDVVLQWFIKELKINKFLTLYEAKEKRTYSKIFIDHRLYSKKKEKF